VTTPLQDIVDEGLARRDDPLLLHLVHRRRTGRDLDQRFENGTDGARVDSGLAQNLRGGDGHGGANYEALFARMSQFPLAFVPIQSNGRDVLMGA